MNWNLKPQVSEGMAKVLAASLSTQKEFPLPLAKILIQRGILSYEEAREFFLPAQGILHDPFLLTDMGLAVDRLLDALEQGEQILLFGDYDVDGTTAVATMALIFRDLGFRFTYYVPDRNKEA